MPVEEVPYAMPHLNFPGLEVGGESSLTEQSLQVALAEQAMEENVHTALTEAVSMAPEEVSAAPLAAAAAASPSGSDNTENIAKRQRRETGDSA